MHIDETPIRVALQLDPAAMDAFSKGTWSAGVVAGVGIGFRTFGGQERHDFLLADLRSGRLISGRLAEGRWYEGQVELLGHLTVGTQYHPDTAYFFGLNPGLRYHFTAGGPIVPFLHASAGVSATDIGRPDLSTIFQFNEQGGIGVQWFLSDPIVVTAEYRFMHISNAHIRRPNHGVNSNLFLAGVAWRF
jgi:opacity protein-like surface antigen